MTKKSKVLTLEGLEKEFHKRLMVVDQSHANSLTNWKELPIICFRLIVGLQQQLRELKEKK